MGDTLTVTDENDNEYRVEKRHLAQVLTGDAFANAVAESGEQIVDCAYQPAHTGYDYVLKVNGGETEKVIGDTGLGTPALDDLTGDRTVDIRAVEALSDDAYEQDVNVYFYLRE